MGENLKGSSKLLTLTQNGCLRIINGAYKAILARYFELKMVLYLNKWVADFKHRIEASGILQLLRAAGAKAAEMVAGRWRHHKRRALQLTFRD
jgi:hypothetical protein